jgi:hypothetical protein
MSYDIYCYKSQFGKPDLEEAQAAIEAHQDGEVVSNPETKFRISKALIEHNPRFQSFEFDYDEIARIQNISVEEAKKQFSHIELNTPEGDPVTQITIYEKVVSITVPYWYSGEQATEVFNDIFTYAKLIRQVTGYFVYDPQKEQVYDPLIENLFQLDLYESMTGQVAKITTDGVHKPNTKPWWKFW